MSGSGLVGILHAVVITGDLERTLHFYVGLLGLVPGPIRDHEPDRLARLGGPANAIARAVILKAPDGSEIEIACFERPRGTPITQAAWQDAGIRSVTFVVVDIRTMATRLELAGYSLSGEITLFIEDWRPVLVAYVHGQDGVVVTLLQTHDVTGV